ncbi:MAG TPA: NosL family protein [Desulfuromonadales bacterium]|nr:NosL family protein [Desulfuromonadales bacterium]
MEGHEGHKQGSAAEASHADVKKIQSCAHCGMDREKFSHSRMLLTYADGTTVGVCSLNCTATELKASKGKVLKSIQVGDYNSKKLIDAEKATWVIGGSKKGVMTRNAKWAFAAKGDAEAFIKKNGGKLGTYKEALALAEKE